MSSTTAPSTTSFGPQFSGFPTGTRRPNPTSTSRSQSNGLDTSGYRYYILGTLLGVVFVGIMLWLRWRFTTRQGARNVATTRPVVSQRRPPFFDAYLVGHEQIREKDGQWEIMPLAVSTIGDSSFASSREPPAHLAQKGASANASPPARAQVALLIIMPAPMMVTPIFHISRLGPSSWTSFIDKTVVRK
ncbi:hypothetical protein C8R44DRAFT_123920 [Mycena epipterygia]|nr:hypothetical protein C8R44DRAFT_123920 [Mycena epipterygia]